MDSSAGIDSDAMWKRVGLEELRDALRRVTTLAREFENALKALPPCDACARTALLTRIEASGRQLGGAAISVSTLADVLKQAQAAAEQAQHTLISCAPESCACPAGQCACDHARR